MPLVNQRRAGESDAVGIGNKRAVYADSAYRSKNTEEKLAEAGIASQICENGTRAAALTGEQKEANRKKSKVCARSRENAVKSSGSCPDWRLEINRFQQTNGHGAGHPKK